MASETALSGRGEQVVGRGEERHGQVVTELLPGPSESRAGVIEQSRPHGCASMKPSPSGADA